MHPFLCIAYMDVFIIIIVLILENCTLGYNVNLSIGNRSNLIKIIKYMHFVFHQNFYRCKRTSKIKIL